MPLGKYVIYAVFLDFVVIYAIFPPNPNSQIFRIDKKNSLLQLCLHCPPDRLLDLLTALSFSSSWYVGSPGHIIGLGDDTDLSGGLGDDAELLICALPPGHVAALGGDAELFQILICALATDHIELL